MTPTIVTRDGRTVLVLGSPGGSQIITTVLQVLLDVVDFKMNVQEAVDAPRFHHQWSPDVVSIEKDRFAPDLLSALGALGHTTTSATPMGEVYAIAVDPASGERTGASDPRADGATVGY
jgi:gamma-glutamyltranspeptidase/glutathione hydrolase